MRLIGREHLVSLSALSPESAKWVSSWVAELRGANWRQPSDVVGQFPKAYQYENGGFLFPTPPHRIGVYVLVAFSQGVIIVLSLITLEASNDH